MLELDCWRGLRGSCLAATLIGPLLAPAVALAEAELQARYDVLDADGDGVVQRVEYETRKVEVLFGNDANGDGRLSADETHVSEEVFERLDADGDGQLSGVELLEAQEFQFLSVDRDGDGTLTFEEFEALAEAIRQ